MGLFGPPRDAKLKAWKIPTFSLCWTAVLTVFLTNRHRRSNPPTYSTHPDMYGSTRKTAEMAEGSQEADRDWDSSIQVLRCQIKIKEQPVLSHFPIISSNYDNCDEGSTGSGVRCLGHQLWSMWTKNWVANRSKPTKRRGHKAAQ